jgi:uncharacterized protein YyaL (SSP411 family)
MREVVTRTLDQMLASPLHDTVDGGFFRFSRTPDWQTPNHEKLLDQNALVLRACLEAFQVFGAASYRAAAEGIVRLDDRRRCSTRTPARSAAARTATPTRSRTTRPNAPAASRPPSTAPSTATPTRWRSRAC